MACGSERSRFRAENVILSMNFYLVPSKGYPIGVFFAVRFYADFYDATARIYGKSGPNFSDFMT